MPKFNYTKTVYHYSFNPPSTITKAEYESYKQMLKVDPRADLAPDSGVRKRNDFMYVLVVIGIICFLIGLFTCLGAEKSSDAPGWAICMVFGSLFFVLHPIINGGKLESSINEDKADNDRTQFYENLRAMIISSNSYEEFIGKYRLKYRAYY
jgi:hypothetical protein